jgi:hypothetical protein
VKQGKYQQVQKSKDEYDNRLAEVKSVIALIKGSLGNGQHDSKNKV